MVKSRQQSKIFRGGMSIFVGLIFKNQIIAKWILIKNNVQILIFVFRILLKVDMHT